MGIAHSSVYQNLEPKPLVGKVSNSWAEGEEWVRFIDTTWSDVRKPTYNSSGDPVYLQKVIKVQGCSSGEVYHLSKCDLIRALGDVRETSKFVSSARDHELFCRWSTGYIRCPDGQVREGCWAEAVKESETVDILRRVAV